jgi:hypothetical protein
MKEIELSPEQLTTLDLFSHYCRSYGAKEVNRSVWFQFGSEEWAEYSWSSPQRKLSIESYSSIDNLLDFLIEKHSLFNLSDDWDNESKVTFDIDCISKTMRIYAYENVNEYVDSGAESDSNETDSLLLFFTEMKNQGVVLGTVDFSGGGDSGTIEGRLQQEDGVEIVLPLEVEDFLYSMLSDHQSGWENDDGSQGTFTFDFEEDKVILDFQLNTKENYKIDTEYVIHF